ncbi:hypothetical protein [Pseudanabaena yagii]|uniref:Uncharacterized protein n=1 Tax=Pseudanabaena yagii GIHE-NHR1 TaxID=2722753 RepID=A0ABX1LVV3_9CYAN|nr:hypothetical protein [Pseudanabaena yagii]NMF58002.1 hypothetical protein [Pseudanabaena yagii GIHE-NHR1]
MSDRLFLYPKFKQAIAPQFLIFAVKRTLKEITNNLSKLNNEVEHLGLPNFFG